MLTITVSTWSYLVISQRNGMHLFYESESFWQDPLCTSILCLAAWYTSQGTSRWRVWCQLAVNACIHATKRPAASFSWQDPESILVSEQLCCTASYCDATLAMISTIMNWAGINCQGCSLWNTHWMWSKTTMGTWLQHCQRWVENALYIPTVMSKYLLCSAYFALFCRYTLYKIRHLITLYCWNIEERWVGAQQECPQKCVQ